MKKINCVKIMGILTTIVVCLSLGIVGTDVERIDKPLYTYTTHNTSNNIEEVKDNASVITAVPTIAPITSMDEYNSNIEEEYSTSNSKTNNTLLGVPEEATEESDYTEKTIYIGSQDLRFSYMDWRTITDQTSDQWKLQNWYSITDWTTGIRTVNGRYSVAVGSTVSVEKGRYIDIYLENGTIIPCIISDTKADYDTWGNDGVVGNDGSVIEFIVDTDVMSAIDIGSVTAMGDYKYLSDDWNSPVDHINVLTYGQDID